MSNVLFDKLVSVSGKVYFDDLNAVPGASGTAYSLNAAQGGFTLNGYTTTLAKVGGHAAYALSCAQGAFTLVGQQGYRDYALGENQGTFTLTGFTAALQAVRALACAKGTFGFVGVAALLSWSGHKVTATLPKWTRFDLACTLRCLQQGTLNVGNTQQNRLNLFNLAVINANTSAAWAKWGSQASRSHSNLLLWVPAVPGYVAPAGAPGAR